MRLKSPWRTLARLAGLALVAGAVGAAPAAALPEGYHYEMVSPPDKNDGDVGGGAFAGAFYGAANGERIAYTSIGGFGDAQSNGIATPYMAKRGNEHWASNSLALPIAPSFFLTANGVTSVSPDFTKALSVTTVDLETGDWLPPDQAQIHLLDVDTGDLELFNVPDVDGNSQYTMSADTIDGNADYSRVVYDTSGELVEDDLNPGDSRVYLREEDGQLTPVNVLPGGDHVPGRLSDNALHSVSEEADVVFFTTRFAGTVQPDDRGIYRRDLESGTTTRVNADENSNEDPPAQDAVFAGASPDGRYAYFISNQPLVDEDTDTADDLYRYDHSQPAGSRLELVSADNNPDDAGAGSVVSLGVSADGETSVFAATSQLVPGEPTDPGMRLYTWREGQVSHIGLIGPNFNSAPNDRSRLLSDDGETFAFVSQGDPIGENPNGFWQLYVLDVPSGDLTCPTCANGTANGMPQLFRMPNLGMFTGSSYPRRAVSSEGHVFFHTADSLLPQDTNGKIDVYVWQDGELDLVSTGRDVDHSHFVEASADGSTVFFVTREQLSAWDWDNRLDIYAARTGDALPEPSEPVQPCKGSDCQGPPSLPPAYPGAGSGHYDGPGNPQADPVDCTPAERKANRLANKAQQASKKAKRLKKQARKASGKKAKRLNKRAKKAQRQAKAKRKQARQARNQLALCREEAEL